MMPADSVGDMSRESRSISDKKMTSASSRDGFRADGLTSGALAEVLTDYALDPTIAFVIFPRPGSPHTRRECSPTIFSEP